MSEKKCSLCGNPLRNDAVFCVVCGTPAEASAPATVTAPTSPKMCMNCGAMMQVGTTFCTECGHSAAPAPSAPVSEPVAAPPTAVHKIVCMNCGAEIKNGAAFCTECGQKIDVPAAPEVIKPTPVEPIIIEDAVPEASAPAEQPAPSKENDESAVCTGCGAKLGEGVAFCTECGTKVTAAPVIVEAEKAVSDSEPTSAPEPAPAPAPTPAALCPACSAPLKNGAAFCTKCGFKLGAPAPTPAPMPEPSLMPEPAPSVAPEKVKKSPLIAIIIIIASLLVLGGGAVCGYIFWLHPKMLTEDIVTAVNKGDYVAADTSFKELGKSNDDIASAVKKRAPEVYEEYKDETLKYKDAVAELEALTNWNIASTEEALTEAAAKVEALKISRDAYDKAAELDADGDFIGAVGYYQQVIEEDPNYDNAQQAISASFDDFENSVKEEAEEAAKEKTADGYLEARDIIAKGLKTLTEQGKSTDNLDALYTSYTNSYIDFIIDEADQKEKDAYFSDAIKLVTDANNIVEDDRFADKLEDLEDSLADYYLRKAQELSDAGDKIAAHRKLEEGLEKLPNREDLIQKRDELADLIENPQ